MPDNGNLNSRLSLLLRLVESITASPDLDQLLGRVVPPAPRPVDDPLTPPWILEGSRLVARARGGARSQSTAAGRSEFTLGEGLVGHAALERRTLLAPGGRGDPRGV